MLFNVKFIDLKEKKVQPDLGQVVMVSSRCHMRLQEFVPLHLKSRGPSPLPGDFRSKVEEK